MVENEPCVVKLKSSFNFSMFSTDFIYVERSYNTQANEFIISHLNNGFFSRFKKSFFYPYKLFYLPDIAKSLQNNSKVLEYANPSRRELDIEHIYDTIFDGIVGNSEALQSGFLHRTDIYEEEGFYYYSYTPFVQQDVENIHQLFADIINRDKAWSKAHQKESDSDNIRFCIKMPENPPADDTFSWDSLNLIKEIEERVTKLEQHGISRAVLFKMLGDDVKLSRMIIDSKYRIYLIDYDYMEIKMTPLVKAVFLLFLNHPEGILFKELGNYKNELTRIYTKISNRSDVNEMRRSIDDICNPLNNSINEKCARIREAFVANFDSEIAKNYCVTGEKGQPKRIILDRSLVIAEKF